MFKLPDCAFIDCQGEYRISLLSPENTGETKAGGKNYISALADCSCRVFIGSNTGNSFFEYDEDCLPGSDVKTSHLTLYSTGGCWHDSGGYLFVTCLYLINFPSANPCTSEIRPLQQIPASSETNLP